MCTQPTVDIPEYFSLLPSEICRLILGYLRHNGHHNAACSLFLDSKELAELRTQYSKLSDLPMHLTQITLIDLIQDYLRVANAVAHLLARTNLSCKLGSIASVLPCLLKSNVTGAIRVPAGRPIRAAWLPAGKSYLPPRVVAPDQMSNMQNNLRLPLVAVRPHLYSATPVLSQKPTNPRVCAPSTNSNSIPSCSTTANTIPLISSTPGGRPMIRLIRHSTATDVPPTSVYYHELNSGGCSTADSETVTVLTDKSSPSRTPPPSLPDKTELTPIITRTWSSQTETVSNHIAIDNEESIKYEPTQLNEDLKPEVIGSEQCDRASVSSADIQSETKDPMTLGCSTMSSLTEHRDLDVIPKQCDRRTFSSTEHHSETKDTLTLECSRASPLNALKEPEVVVTKLDDHIIIPSVELQPEIKEPATPESSIASSLEATSPLAPTNCQTHSVNSPPCFSVSITRNPTSFSITGTSCSTFTVLKHLPPQSETKRLSRDAELGAREEQKPPVQPGQSRRRRCQTPRHKPSGQVTTSDVTGSTENQNDVDFQRFLSVLFSKPEHLATHINTKLGSVCSRLSGANSEDGSTSVKENQTTPVRVSSATREDRLNASDCDIKPTPSSEKRLQPGSGLTEQLAASPLRNSGTELDEGDVPHPILDWLEDDLESCIDQLLSQFDCDRPVTDQSDKFDEEKYAHQSIDYPRPATPVEVIDLMLPSGASTPAYPLCSSVQTISTTSTTTLTTTPMDVVPEVLSPLQTVSNEQRPPIRPRCSPPLCLSQLARDTDSPHKRRRIDTNSTKEYRSSKSSGLPAATLLQTPDFKETDLGRIEDAELPRHNLFPSTCQIEAYEDYINIRTLYDSPSSDRNSVSNPHSVASQSHLNIPWQPKDANLGSVPSTFPSSHLNPVCPAGSSAVNHVHSSFYSNSIHGIYSTVNHPSVLSSTNTYHGIVTAEPVIDHYPHKNTIIPATQEPTDSLSSQMVNMYPSHYNPSTGQFTSVAVSPASTMAPTSLLTSLNQPHRFENSQSLSVNSSSVFPQGTSHPGTTWSESIIFLPKGLHNLPVIPLEQTSGVSSMPTLLIYKPTVTSTTITNLSSASDVRALQPIHYNTSSPSSDGLSSSVYNPTAFQLPKGSVSWSASPGSTLIAPVNVDLDSPNPHGFSSASQSSPLCGVPARPKIVPSANSAHETGVSRDTAVCSSSPSVTSSTIDKENQRPPPTTQKKKKKNPRRKVLNLELIDVDQILSKSHCE